MKAVALVLAAAMALAACGVDGPPQPPGAAAAAPGVTVGGEIRLGVSGEL